jgi:3-oxoacyl-[acyl-carrier-protein] synthase-3
MLEILDIGIAMPQRLQSMQDASEELLLSAKDRRMYERFFGLGTFPRDASQTLNAMTEEACIALAEKIPFVPQDVDMVFYCHTLMGVVPIHQDVVLPIAGFATDRNEVFSLTMNHCATAVSAMEFIDCMLPHNGTALLLIGDKGFHRVLREIPNTTIMGECAVAMLLARRPGKYCHIATHTERRGRYAIMTGLVGATEEGGFAREYVDFVADCINAALTRAGIDVSQVRLILPHNVNLPSWDQISDRCGARRDQVYLRNVPRYGHMFNADPFLNLVNAIDDGRLSSGDLVALVSVGLGATASCSVFRVRSAAFPTAQHPATMENSCA